MQKHTLYIIDFFNLLFRMFYAVPEMRTKDGQSVNAAFGVIRFLLQLLQEQASTHLVIACDAGSHTFRTDMYADYKSNRDKMPDDLSSQLDIVWKFLELAEIPREILKGYEADDIIGTLATKYANDPDVEEIVIISSDKDLFQFIDGKTVFVYDGMKKRKYDLEGSREKFGVDPEYIVDFLAIVGDASDCIPGVRGIGPKGAVKLISQYGTVENIYTHIDEIVGRTQTLLIESRDLAFMSKKLATIDCTVPLEHTIEDYCNKDIDDIFGHEELIELLYKYEFRSLIPVDFQQKQYTISENIQTHIVASDSEFDELKKKLMDLDMITFMTTGDRDILRDMYISTNRDTVYIISSEYLIARDCIRFLEDEYQGKVKGFDLHADKRRMQMHLTRTEDMQEIQSLF